MTQQFNISTVFSAVNHLTSPMRDMTRQMSQFATAARTASSTANASLNGTTAAVSNLHRDINALNHLNFNVLTSRLRGLREHINSMSRGFQSAGNAAMGIGAAGLGVGYGLSRTLEPVREAQRASTQLGVVYGQGKTVNEQETIGNEQYKITAALANKLPGAVAAIADFRAFTKSYGVEGSYELIRGFTDALGRMGKATLDTEVIASIQSVMIGNQSDLFEKTGLKSHTDRSTHEVYLEEMSSGKKRFFKNDAEKLRFLSEYLGNRYKGGTELAMKKTGGLESNAGDALNAAAVDVWNSSGGLKLYNEKVVEFTRSVSELTPKLAALIKPLVDFANRNKEFTNSMLIAVPAMFALGGVLKVVGFALSGFSGLIAGVIGTLNLLRNAVVAVQGAYTLATTGATLFTAATGLVLAPVVAITAAVVALGAAIYAVALHWGELTDGFDQSMARMKNGLAEYKFPKLGVPSLPGSGVPKALRGDTSNIYGKQGIRNTDSLYDKKPASNVIHLEVNNHAQPNGSIKTITATKGSGLTVKTNTGLNQRGQTR